MAETATATMGSHGTPTEHHPTNYIAVFIYLTLLTAAELGVYGLGLPRTIMIGSLVALALAKATLVAMYFMHLAMERKGLWIVAVTPLVIIAFCYFMLRPDLSARSWAAHDENVAIGHREQPETVLPPIPQGKALSNADQPAGSQVGQPNPAPMGAQSPSGTAASPGASAAGQAPASSGGAAQSGGSQAPAPPQ
ncbi:MAG TPA: cytochrome C oxidase subunit IV family protein [Candidatus Binataceae bacterium]|nr:cytochrome C oxidase subunit IV family protein [Candidatus Binataceae bacterium]